MTPDPMILAPTTFALRLVRIGVRATMLTVALALVMPLLPDSHFTSTPAFLAITGAAAAAAILARLAPWEQLLGTRRGSHALEAWAYSLILTITAAILVAGRVQGEGHLYLHLVVLYFALILETSAMLRVTVVAAAATLGMGLTSDLIVAHLVTRVAILLLLAYLARVTSQVLTDRLRTADAARTDADARARVLATVAGSARAIGTLEPEEMLPELVAAGLALGFETGNVCQLSADQRTYAIVAPVGHGPLTYPTAEHAADQGMVALVIAQQTPVVVGDYANHPLAVAELRDQGFRAVVGVPIWVHNRLDACLVVGTRAQTTVPSEVVEALELLAALAGRALENAARFEEQAHEAQRLSRLNDLKSDFVSNVSHELRTPLAVIQGIGETLEHRVDALDGGLARQLVSRLNVNAASLGETLARLLDFSRLEHGTLDVEVADVRLCDLTRDVLARMEPLLREHVLEVQVEENLPVRADRFLVERIVENLVGNAAKHTPAGTRITVRASRHGSVAEVRVGDDGPGISVEDLAHLTDRFFRGGDPTTRERKGLGLGLALVDELLRLHGTQLVVTSELGEGTTFTFELPLEDHAPGRMVGRWDQDLDPARRP